MIFQRAHCIKISIKNFFFQSYRNVSQFFHAHINTYLHTIYKSNKFTTIMSLKSCVLLQYFVQSHLIHSLQSLENKKFYPPGLLSLNLLVIAYVKYSGLS